MRVSWVLVLRMIIRCRDLLFFDFLWFVVAVVVMFVLWGGGGGGVFWGCWISFFLWCFLMFAVVVFGCWLLLICVDVLNCYFWCCDVFFGSVLACVLWCVIFVFLGGVCC